jgi:hypothetical protein
MKKLALLVLLFASSAALAQDQPQATTATICFYRPHRFEGAALKPPILVDEVDVAHLHNGDALQVTVNPGSHQIHSNDKSTGIELDAKAGQTYFVRVDIKAGAWKGHGQITLIDPQEGKFEFSKQKVSVTKDLSTNQASPAAEPPKAPAAATSPAAPNAAQTQNPQGQNAAAQNSAAQSPTAQVQATDQQQPSLGDVARQYRDKKTKPQTQQQDQPQN